MTMNLVQNLDQHQAHTPVLISGGGLVGLVTGLFLQHQGVPFILIEQRESASVLPRARGIHARSMELFRQVGLEADLQAAAAAAWKVGSFGGARRGPSMLASQPIAAFAARPADNTIPSPSHFCACSQTIIEEVLHRPLVARGGDVRFGHRLDAFTQDADGVTATVVDTQGQTTYICADYLIAADGGRSLARHALHIGSDRTPALQHYLNIFFRADLTDRMEGRTFSQCEVENERVKGLMISKDNATEWSFHLEYDPQTTDPSSFTPADLVGFVRAALGDPEQPVRIIATSTWSTLVRVAQHYRDGHIFLVGDAAHVMPPWGGFNGNTGIADAHNLSWKLAAVLTGHAADALLDTYETKRRPVAARNGVQARLRTDFEARFNLETPHNHEVFEQLEDINTLLMKYPYPDLMQDGTPSDRPAEHLTAQLGTRFPHAWLLRGEEKVSTLDLFGRAPVLLVGPTASRAWTTAEATKAQLVAWGDGAQVCQVGQEVAFADPDMSWEGLTQLPNDGAVLIRPDGFVQGRSDAALQPQ